MIRSSHFFLCLHPQRTTAEEREPSNRHVGSRNAVRFFWPHMFTKFNHNRVSFLQTTHENCHVAQLWSISILVLRKKSNSSKLTELSINIKCNASLASSSFENNIMDSNGKHYSSVSISGRWSSALQHRSQTDIDLHVDIQWSSPPTARKAPQQHGQWVSETFPHSLLLADMIHMDLQILYVQIRYTFSVGSEESWTSRKLKLWSKVLRKPPQLKAKQNLLCPGEETWLIVICIHI